MDSVGEIVEIHANAVRAGFANTALLGQRGHEGALAKTTGSPRCTRTGRLQKCVTKGYDSFDSPNRSGFCTPINRFQS